MPRKQQENRGGTRQLAQGDNSGNRTDLNLHQPIMAADNQGYGVKGQQLAAERAVPLPQTQAPAVGGPAGPESGGGDFTAPSTPAPGSLLFDHPSTNPNEPITNGLDFGPGAGPEALQSAPSLTQQLSSLAASPNASSTLQDLAASARSLGY